MCGNCTIIVMQHISGCMLQTKSQQDADYNYGERDWQIDFIARFGQYSTQYGDHLQVVLQSFLLRFETMNLL